MVTRNRCLAVSPSRVQPRTALRTQTRKIRMAAKKKARKKVAKKKATRKKATKKKATKKK